MKPCSVPGCKKPHIAKGYCGSHYANWRRHGFPVLPEVTPRGEPRRWLASQLIVETDECVLWPYSRNGDGYGTVLINGKVVGAHRWVCQQVNGPAPKGRYQAAHSCGKGHLGCVNKRHISWKSPVENAADRKMHGTEPFGERRASAKLTEEKVAAMLRDWSTGRYLKKDLASKYGVSAGAVWAVFAGRTWLGVERGSTARSEAA